MNLKYLKDPMNLRYLMNLRCLRLLIDLISHLNRLNLKYLMSPTNQISRMCLMYPRYLNCLILLMILHLVLLKIQLRYRL
jgi:hypothetical protein